MVANPLRSVTAQLSRISVGLPRVTTRLKWTTEQLEKRPKKQHKKRPPKWEPGYGEKFFIFSHRANGLTVYSHDPILRANRALKQIPFNGKKLKPAKYRKDYWRRLAMVQFPEGLGHVGRSVFHIMREFRMKHELDWGEEVLYDDEHHTRTKHERGKALNDQKANSIADLAAVLAGAGKGNKMWISASSGGENVDTDVLEHDAASDTKKGLVKATVFWESEQDMHFAEEWTGNVTHALFEGSHFVPLEGVDGAVAGGSEAAAVKAQQIPPEPSSEVPKNLEKSQS